MGTALSGYFEMCVTRGVVFLAGCCSAHYTFHENGGVLHKPGETLGLTTTLARPSDNNVRRCSTLSLPFLRGRPLTRGRVGGGGSSGMDAIDFQTAADEDANDKKLPFPNKRPRVCAACPPLGRCCTTIGKASSKVRSGFVLAPLPTFRARSGCIIRRRGGDSRFSLRAGDRTGTGPP